MRFRFNFWLALAAAIAAAWWRGGFPNAFRAFLIGAGAWTTLLFVWWVVATIRFHRSPAPTVPMFSQLTSKGIGTVEIWTRGVAGVYESQVFDPAGSSMEPLERRTWSTWEEARKGHVDLARKWGHPELHPIPGGWNVPVN